MKYVQRKKTKRFLKLNSFFYIGTLKILIILPIEDVLIQNLIRE